LSDAYSDELIRTLCHEFFLATYIDNNGKECISYLPYSGIGGLTTIGYGDIVGEIGDLIEPRTEDIYCEPFVRYNWDEGSQKFLNVLTVKNVSAAAYNAAYTTGFVTTSSGDQETLWDNCQALWKKCHQIGQPGTDLTDLKWIRTELEAFVYLQTWILWMTKRRVKFSLPYETGKNWHISKHIGLNLPHHTGGISWECAIETIEKNKNGNIVNLQVILLAPVVS
jgi:hypothetical protein